jgi:Ni/Co efflux regulator RcnB
MAVKLCSGASQLRGRILSAMGITLIPLEEDAMNRTTIGITAAALLSLSAIAAAHGGRDFDRGYGNHGGNGQAYGRVQPDYRSGYRGDRYDRADRAPGYVMRPWRRGDRLPTAYWSRNDYVTDYPRYRLYAPPRGYGWVRVDNDLLLTALATGLVFDVVYNLGR